MHRWLKPLADAVRGPVKAALRRAGPLIVRKGGSVRLRRRAAVKAETHRAGPVIVLSLGALGNGAHVARAARAMGHPVHVFCGDLPIEEARYADVWHRVDAQHDIETGCRIAREIGAVAVLVEAMNAVLPMKAALMEQMGRTDFGQTSALTSNSKARFRACIDAAGLPNLAWGLLSTDGNTDTDTDTTPPPVPFPLIVKPDLGTGSRGVRLVSNEADLSEALAALGDLASDPVVGGSIVVEQYVRGRQFDVEGLSCAGRASVLCVVEEMYEAAPPHFPPSWFLFNPPLAADLKRHLETLAVQVVEACGVVGGAWHCEIRQTPDGALIPIDFGNRMGYHEPIRVATGVDVPAAYARLMIRGPAAWTPPHPVPRAVLQLYVTDPDDLKRLRRLWGEHPEMVAKASMQPFQLGGQSYVGKVLLQAADFETLRALVIGAGLCPPLFEALYPPAAQST